MSLLHPFLLSLAGVVFLSGATASAHPDTLLQIDGLTAKLGAEPERVELLLARAALYLEHDSFDSALADYRAFAAARPADPRGSLCIAHVLCMAQRWPDAERCLDTHLKQFGDDPAAYVLKCEAAEATKRQEDALAFCQRAIQFRAAPSFDDWTRLIRLQSELKTGDLSAARTSLREARRLFPKRNELVTLEIDLAERAADWPAAVGALDEFMRPLHRKEVYLARKSGLLERSGDVRAAITVCQQCRDTISALPPFLQAQEHVQTLIQQIDARLVRLQKPAANSTQTQTTP